jgi:thioredoxin-dependent peroxiredoxin
MKRGFIFAVIAGIFAWPAQAALKNGTLAPVFTTQASLAGEEFTFSLADALRSGPVVLFFYPKAFTRGCTVEAHMFAEASDAFKVLGATVIGISNDDIETLNKFSVEACQNKVAVAADGDGKIIKAYDASLLFSYASRTSFVIAPDGSIIYSYTAMSPDLHVSNTMDAVKKWHAAQAKG